MKIKNICLIIITILIVAIVFFIIKNLYNSSNNLNSVTIIQHELGGFKEIKNIKINSDSDINKIRKFKRKLKPEYVDLELIREIEIVYNENITIAIFLEREDFCEYINKEKNVSYISKMPEGLYEWVEEKIK